ncbi:MAG: XRE family transcriptional regulator [Thermodesulfobacteriota bacterium]|nr:XRE family transcriptional regulator [Thermodesulfobacteriota bacterium]
MARSKYAEYEKNIIKNSAMSLRRILSEKGLSQTQLADMTGIALSTINDYCNAKTLMLPGNLQTIADTLCIEKSDIETNRKEETFSGIKMLPLYENISCGDGTMVLESPVSYESTPADWINGSEYFYLKARGESMSGARIHDGDLLLIRRQPTVENGEIAAVIIDDEAVLKRVYIDGDKLILQSENPANPPKSYDAGDIYIAGKLKKIIINVG